MDDRNYCEQCQQKRSLHKAQQKYNIIYQKLKRARKQQKGLQNIESESFVHRQILLTDIKADIRTCNKIIQVFQLELSTKAQVIMYRLYNGLRDVDVKHRYLKQMKKMIILIAGIQKYEQKNEKSAISPVKFLKNKKPPPNPGHSTFNTQHKQALDGCLTQPRICKGFTQ